MLEQITIKEITKYGLPFLLMAIVVVALYRDNKSNDKDIRAEILMLRKETKECSKSYQTLLLNQLEKNTKQIDESNKVLAENTRILGIFTSKNYIR